MLLKDMLNDKEIKYNQLEKKWFTLNKEEKIRYTHNILSWCIKYRNIFDYNFIQHYEEKEQKYSNNIDNIDNIDNIWNNNLIIQFNYEYKWNNRVEIWSKRSKMIYNIP